MVMRSKNSLLPWSLNTQSIMIYLRIVLCKLIFYLFVLTTVQYYSVISTEKWKTTSSACNLTAIRHYGVSNSWTQIKNSFRRGNVRTVKTMYLVRSYYLSLVNNFCAPALVLTSIKI